MDFACIPVDRRQGDDYIAVSRKAGVGVAQPLQCRRPFAGGIQGDAYHVLVVGFVGRQVGRTLEGFHGRLKLIRTHQGQSQGEVAAGVPVVVFDGFAEQRFRLLLAPVAAQEVGQIDVGGGEPGRALDGGFERLCRFLQSAQLSEGTGGVEESLRAIGVEALCGPVFLQRGVEVDLPACAELLAGR